MKTITVIDIDKIRKEIPGQIPFDYRISFYDADGELIGVIEPWVRKHGERSSRTSDANHRLMDEWAASHPCVASAVLKDNGFSFKDGTSIWVGLVDKPYESVNTEKPKPDYKSWLLMLKPRDNVVVRYKGLLEYRHYVGNVKHITPKGFIVLTNGARFDASGIQFGLSKSDHIPPELLQPDKKLLDRGYRESALDWIYGAPEWKNPEAFDTHTLKQFEYLLRHFRARQEVEAAADVKG